jgi:hypothetical protein
VGLREDILANPDCATSVTAKDCQSIAVTMSIGRVRPNAVEIGNGTILQVLGIATGNALLDILMSSAVDSPFRHVKPLLEQGRLLIGTPLVQETLSTFVPSVISQIQCDALCALGKEPDPYTTQDIAQALFNDDGSAK